MYAWHTAAMSLVGEEEEARALGGGRGRGARGEGPGAAGRTGGEARGVLVAGDARQEDARARVRRQAWARRHR